MQRGAGPAPDDLDRFVDAQAGTYERALAELHHGRKTGHWIWFVFPQIAGLGSSEMSRYYAIRSMDEARRYLAHPVLGARLRECARALLDLDAGTAEEILGSMDARKVRSSMTLFHRADPAEGVFTDVLDRYYAGVADPTTDGRLGTGPAHA